MYESWYQNSQQPCAFCSLANFGFAPWCATSHECPACWPKCQLSPWELGGKQHLSLEIFNPLCSTVLFCSCFFHSVCTEGPQSITHPNISFMTRSHYRSDTGSDSGYSHKHHFNWIEALETSQLSTEEKPGLAPVWCRMGGVSLLLYCHFWMELHKFQDDIPDLDWKLAVSIWAKQPTKSLWASLWIWQVQT